MKLTNTLARPAPKPAVKPLAPKSAPRRKATSKAPTSAKPAPAQPAQPALNLPPLAAGPLPALERLWVAGDPVGVNHATGQRRITPAMELEAAITGKPLKRRFKTKSATEWEAAVEDTVALAARIRGLHGIEAWGADDSKKGAPALEIDLHFVFRESRQRTRPDADAAQKLTQDAVARALGWDDRVAKRVSSCLTVLPYNSTLGSGCLISVRRLSNSALAALDAAVLAAAQRNFYDTL